LKAQNPKKLTSLKPIIHGLTTMSHPSPFQFKPTAQWQKEQMDKLKKQGGVHMKREDVQEHCKMILSTKNKKDIAFTYVKHVNAFSVFNTEEMKDSMKLWKSHAKEGKLTMFPENNLEYEMDGKKLYTLVVSPKADMRFCPISLFLFDTMVSGHTYVYTKKENRDSVYAYVKKYCIPDEDFTDKDEEEEDNEGAEEVTQEELDEFFSKDNNREEMKEFFGKMGLVNKMNM